MSLSQHLMKLATLYFLDCKTQLDGNGLRVFAAFFWFTLWKRGGVTRAPAVRSLWAWGRGSRVEKPKSAPGPRPRVLSALPGTAPSSPSSRLKVFWTGYSSSYISQQKPIPVHYGIFCARNLTFMAYTCCNNHPEELGKSVRPEVCEFQPGEPWSSLNLLYRLVSHRLHLHHANLGSRERGSETGEEATGLAGTSVTFTDTSN